ncbi:MAG: PorT family protein [Paludibacteraceae bacterium]|nr:PorT family protein [Paludibacteraceae bacterium]
MKKVVFSILLLVMSLSAYSANTGRMNNLINADNRLYHFGFILGLNMMDFNPTNAAVVYKTSPDAEEEIWFGEDIRMTPGFTVGIISDLRIFSWLNLRFCPQLYFNERCMQFRDSEGNLSPKGNFNIQSNIMEFPLDLKFRGQRKHNYRPYLLAGAAMTLDMGRDAEAAIMLKQVDYGVEFGIGCDFYLPYFKLAPEFKIYLGLGDVLERDRPEIADFTDLKYTNTLSKLTSRLFILSFNFE